jgi:thymidylate synthase (FAD)
MERFSVKYITSTKDGEKEMSYVARVSNPNNQDNPEYAKLLKYCIKHKHWSIFETASMTLEIKTTRGIAAQILRHRSATFQEFSQRYSTPTEFIQYEARRQDTKNKQNSIDDIEKDTQIWFKNAQEEIVNHSKLLYDIAIKRGIAKECARNLLPLSTATTLYMTNNCRNWIHYIELRTTEGTQKEHRDIANAIKDVFIKEWPIVAEALEWK